MTVPAALLATLPREILDRLFVFCSTRSLCAINRVCSTLHLPACASLYAHLAFRHAKPFRLFIRTLRQAASYGALIRTLELYEHGRDAVDPLRIITDDLHTVAATCQQLIELTLDYWNYDMPMYAVERMASDVVLDENEADWEDADLGDQGGEYGFHHHHHHHHFNQHHHDIVHGTMGEFAIGGGVMVFGQEGEPSNADEPLSPITIMDVILADDDALDGLPTTTLLGYQRVHLAYLLNLVMMLQHPSNGPFNVPFTQHDSHFFSRVFRPGTLIRMEYRDTMFSFVLSAEEHVFNLPVAQAMNLVPMGSPVLALPLALVMEALPNFGDGTLSSSEAPVVTLRQLLNQVSTMVAHGVQQHHAHAHRMHTPQDESLPGDSQCLPSLQDTSSKVTKKERNLLPKLRKLFIRNFDERQSNQDTLDSHDDESLRNFLLPLATQIYTLDVSFSSRYGAVLRDYHSLADGTLRHYSAAPPRAPFDRSSSLSTDVVLSPWRALKRRLAEFGRPLDETVPEAKLIGMDDIHNTMPWGLTTLNLTHADVCHATTAIHTVVQLQDTFGATYPGLRELRLVTHQSMSTRLFRLIGQLANLRTLFLYGIDEPVAMELNAGEIAGTIVPEASRHSLRQVCIGAGDHFSAGIARRVLQRGGAHLERFRIHENVSTAVLSDRRIREQWPDWCVWSGALGRSHGCRCTVAKMPPLDDHDAEALLQRARHDPTCPALTLVARCWERNRCLWQHSAEGYYGKEG